jgi:guanylate kinase
VDPLRHMTRPLIAEFEKDGEDGHFVSAERLSTDVENGKFFHTEQDEAGNVTAISFQAVDDVIAAGHVPILAIPVASVRKASSFLFFFFLSTHRITIFTYAICLEKQT